MKIRLLLFATLLFSVSAHAETRPDRTLAQLPLLFEPNHGQADERVKFLARGPGYGLFLTADEAIVKTGGPKPGAVRMQLLGHAAHADIRGVEASSAKTNYMMSADRKRWIAGIETFHRVLYSGVYPGIDLIYYGNQRRLEYDFDVAPGAQPDAIRLRFDGIKSIRIDSDGQLVLRTSAGEIRQPRPVIYQEDNGSRTAVEGGYVMRGRRTVGFHVSQYDKTKRLVIDPILYYSTYFGGTAGDATGDQAQAIALDAAGSVYVSGQTTSTDLLIVNGAQQNNNGAIDGFVVKIDITGNVVYSTYFGGSANEDAHSIAVDSAGNAYVTGFTSSDNFPTTPNAFQRTRSPNQEAYFLKLDSVGSNILYASYLGGNGDDRALAIALDTAGSVYIAGLTGSTNFPTAHPFQSLNGGGLADVFVTKFSQSGSLVYSTYVGGRGNDQALGLAVDAFGSAYVTGYTTSGCPPQSGDSCPESGTFPRVNAVQQAFGGGSDDAFLFKLNPEGNGLIYSTFIGGIGSDNATRVAVDPTGRACVTGYTLSTDFPVVNPFQALPLGGYDAFITCLSADGTTDLFSTLYGGDGNDSGVGIAFDAAGELLVAGYTESFVLNTVNAVQGSNGGQRDGFVMKIDPSMTSIIYSTYLGGSGVDSIVGLAVDAVGNAFVAGLTNSTNLPVSNAFQVDNAGGVDAFVAMITATDIITSSNFAIAKDGGTDVSTTSVSTNSVFGYATADVATANSPTGLEILSYFQNGATVTEVGIPAPALLQNGRVFVQVDSSTRSVISVANPSDDDATVNFFFTGADGTSSNFTTQTVTAHTHFSAFVSDPPFSLGNPSSGTITFTSDIPIATTAFRTFNNERSDFLISETPITDPYQVTNQVVSIPHFADGGKVVTDDDPDGLQSVVWNTNLILVNTTEDPMSGLFEFVNPQGSAVDVQIGDDTAAMWNYSIPPRSSVSFQTPGTASDLTVGSILIAPNPGTNTPQAHAILSSKIANITVLQTPVEGQLPRQSMRLFAEASGDFDNADSGSIRSAFAIQNPWGLPVAVRLDLTSTDGTPTGRTATLNIPAYGQVASFLNQVPGFEDIPLPYQGILKVTALNGPGITGVGLRTTYNERFQFLATTTGPIVENAGTPTQLVFPHIAEGGGYSTEFILLARPNGQGSAGTLNLFNQQGAPVNVTKLPN